MSEEDQDSADKEHDASPQRLEQARKDGDIPRSIDLQAAASSAGFVLAFATFGPWIVTSTGTAGMVLLGQSDSFAALLAAGATVDALDDKKQTPLHKAAKKGGELHLRSKPNVDGGVPGDRVHIRANARERSLRADIGPKC